MGDLRGAQPAINGRGAVMDKRTDVKAELSVNAIKVLERRYLKKDAKGSLIETPEELFRRVAKNIAIADSYYGKSETDVKRTEEDFFEMMARLEFLPNSPTLMNAGRDLQQLSACFVLPIEDSMEAIFETIKDTAIIHKSGGGTGFSFSRLRAKNSPVRSTGGISSGPVSFMKVFNAATQAVKQGGTRRGANMGILRVDHPDILEFISCKENDKEITNFNISVALTEEFMKKALAGEDYDLIDPKTKKSVQKINAKKVFDMIIQMAWKNGEPGIIFIDRINKDNPTPKAGQIESTNPCVSGESLISTEFGLMRMKDVARRFSDGGIAVLTDDRVLQIKYEALSGGEGPVTSTLIKQGVGLSTISKAWRSGIKETLKLITKSGYEIIATPDHKIMTPDGWVMMRNLNPGFHKILIQSGKGRFNSDSKLPFEVKNEYMGDNGQTYKLNLPDRWTRQLGQAVGYMIGDGWLRYGDKDCRVGLTFSAQDEEILTYLKYIMNTFYGSSVKEVVRENGVYHLSYHSKYFVDFFRQLGVKPWQAGEKEVPESIFTATEDAVAGFLQGLFTADGTVNFSAGRSSYVRLTSKSEKLLKGVQMLLLNLGIKSKIYDRTRKERPGFKYVSKSGITKEYELNGVCFELEISKDAVLEFLDKIGFLCNKHNSKVRKFYTKQYYSTEFLEDIISIEKNKEEEVYDLTEPCSNSFICNGLCISNCGEQPLLPYESCNLGSINLAKMVTEEKEIDWDKFSEIIRKSVHFLDNVIDMNSYPIKKIDEMTKSNRKIGLGVMGFADMLLMMGIRYDSEDAIALAEKLMKFMLDTSRRASEALAKERGAFPNFKGSIYDKKGARALRNATLTTIAPTGTLSIIANSSSGIEPVFAVTYIRNIMDNTKMIEAHPYFREVAERRGFYKPETMNLIAQKGTIHGVPEVPDDVQKLFVTAHDIDAIWHIRMQSAFQKHTNNAVSKTVNLPSEATMEDVKTIYMLAYKSGCKGVTIYRDKSRDEQVLNIPSDNTKGQQKTQTRIKISPRPRPPVIVGTTTKIATGCGNLYITINEDGECQPFEVFMHMGKAGGCAMSQLEAIGRLVSLGLRSGIEVGSIVEQLRGIRCPSPSWEKGGRIFSCSDAIARAVEQRAQDIKNKKIPGNTVSTSETTTEASQPDASGGSSKTGTVRKAGNIVGVCPDCGGALWHIEGCMVCKSCGYSKCG